MSKEGVKAVTADFSLPSKSFFKIKRVTINKKINHMPITKEKIGEVTFVNLTFGAGDINVTNGWEQDDKHSTILFLSQHHPKPEVEWDDHSGEWSKKPTGESKTSDTFPDGTIRLKFNKSKSVRIVIEHLIKIEQDLLSLETSK